MSRTSILDHDVKAYATAHSTPPEPIQQALIDATTAATGDQAGMQISHTQAVFMRILTAAIRPRLAVEVGTFTGYSSLAVAPALPEGSRLICCDVSEEWTSIARDHWTRAGVDDRIELRLGPAIETLESLPTEPCVDFAFIDADKTGYRSYYDALLPRLSDRGVILVDNTLWHGAVLTDDDQSADTVALREFNEFVVSDPRSEAVLLTVGDGLTMIRRRT